MKTNWVVNNDSLVFNGSSFLGVVKPTYDNKIVYKAYIREGEFGKKAPSEKYDSLYNAVSSIESFFSMDEELQREKFNNLVYE